MMSHLRFWGFRQMPSKGYKKPNGGRSRPRTNLTLSEQCTSLLEAIASDENLINPRTGEPNKSQAVETAALAYKLFRRTYPDNLPYPQSLMHTLLKLIPYLEAKGDGEQLIGEIEEHIEYIESWGVKAALDEMLAEGVLITPSGDWIC